MSDPPAQYDAPTIRGSETRTAEATKSDCESRLPCRFAGYELISELARGGMGIVFRARQLDLNRIVAVKMILDGRFANCDDVRRFQAEAESAAKLDHPGIVPIHEVGEHEGRHFFSMAFVDGESLSQRLQRGPLEIDDASSMMADVADAVHYAHGQGVIHRDIKPGNILIDEGDRPRVTDFGVAKQLSDDGMTVQGELIGTPGYMPPEQARGDEVTFASDVYSLGAVLYETLTGRAPFQSANQLDTLHQVLEDEVIPPRSLNSQVPHDLETITLKCLEKNPLDRYETAEEVADELRRHLNGESILAKPPCLTKRSRTWIRKNLLVASMSGLTTVALVAGMVGMAWRVRMEVKRADGLEGELIQLRDQIDTDTLRTALAQMQQAEFHRFWRLADSDRIALLAKEEAERDRSLGLLLAIEACKRYPHEEMNKDTRACVVLENLLGEDNLVDKNGVPLLGDKLLDRAQNLAGRTLTESEIKQFVTTPERKKR